MSNHVAHDQLQDLADGTADAAIELHVTECAACRAELEKIRSLKAALGALPREDRVDYSLFPAIRERITPRRNYWKIAALALAAGLAFALIYPRVTETNPALEHEIRGASREYRHALDEMVDELNQRKDSLDPQTVAVVEQNLRVIDEAIRASEKALAADPESDVAAMLVASAYESKLGLLRLVERTGR